MNKINYYPELEIALNRDHHACVECGATDNVIVHHKDNSRKNGITEINNDLDNLITLCRPCHAIAHNQTLRFSKPSIQMIIELRTNGKTYQEIGDYLGISRQRVHQIISRIKIMTL